MVDHAERSRQGTGSALATTDAEGLDSHFRELGLRPGMNLVVHSRLVSFGRIPGEAASVYNALRRAIGAEGTIVVPTYTLDLDDASPFDPAKTPSRGVGALAEFVRALPEARRSLCPMHSHAGVGPTATVIAGSASYLSFGAGSAFECMRNNGFMLLLLGCGFHDGASYVHQVEAEFGVPYREWVELRRKVVGEDAVARDVRFQYYGRRPDAGVELDLHPLEALALEANLVASADAPYGRSFAIPLEQLHGLVAGGLRADPYFLVKQTER
jgi:aminoglycoside N3'-acetyltransferase